MISTFVSLAALVAGAAHIVSPAPAVAPLSTELSEPAIAPEPVPVAAPVPARQESTAKPLPLVQVRAPQSETQGLDVAPDGETERGETLQEQPVITAPVEAPPAETTDAPLSNAPAADQAVPIDEVPDDIAPIADPTLVSPTEQRAILKAAAGALSAVETAQGRFSQIDPTGTRAGGSFALQRPGRMRFDYDDPVPLLIAADGATVAVRDDELETVDRVPLAATPLNLLLDDRLDFETEAEVTRVIKANGQVAITMRDRSGEADGELTLYLDSASYDLMGWRTLDGNDRLTFVELRNVDTGVSLNPRLFIIDEFEDEDDDRR